MNAIQPIPADAECIPVGVPVSDVGTLIDVLAERKAALGLSDEWIEAVGGFSPGHANKMLGPARTKTPSLPSLDILLQLLGLSLVVVDDPVRAARMRDLWLRREEAKVHSNKVGRLTIQRARPFVIRELARAAALARWANTTPDQRRAMAAARKRKRR
jgi:hypothetical protein